MKRFDTVNAPISELAQRAAQQQALVDRDCVLLDGSCKCKKPYEDCKHLSEEAKKQV